MLSRGSGSPIGAVVQGVSAALELVLPRPCPGCGGPGPWCAGCAATLAGRPRRIRLPDLTDDLPAMPPSWALARYRGPVRAAILAGKERGRRELPGLLGQALGPAAIRLQRSSLLPGELWFVPAPSRRSAARRRGGDPVLSMARAAARLIASRGAPAGVAPCLYTARTARDSVGLDGAGRRANLAGRIRLRPAALPSPGARVALVDDVLTTGATTAAAAAVLAAAGVEVAAVLVLASVPGWVATR